MYEIIPGCKRKVKKGGVPTKKFQLECMKLSQTAKEKSQKKGSHFKFQLECIKFIEIWNA